MDSTKFQDIKEFLTISGIYLNISIEEDLRQKNGKNMKK